MKHTIHVPRAGRNRLLRALAFCCMSIILWSSPASRQSYGQQAGSEQNTSVTDVPRLINYQGTLANATGQPVPDGKYSITATLYSDALGSNYVWQDKYDVSV